jgi:hypothetical protein
MEERTRISKSLNHLCLLCTITVDVHLNVARPFQTLFSSYISIYAGLRVLGISELFKIWPTSASCALLSASHNCCCTLLSCCRTQSLSAVTSLFMATRASRSRETAWGILFSGGITPKWHIKGQFG